MEQQCLPFPSFRLAPAPPIGERRCHNETQRQEEEEEEEGSGCGQMPATPSLPKARVFNVHQHTHRETHTLLPSASKGFPSVADESTRGGRTNNGATQWEAGEGSCSVRAGAITARGSNGEHLATEHHSHSPLFVWCWGWRRWRWRGGSTERKDRGCMKD